jgi:hypothetical protein
MNLIFKSNKSSALAFYTQQARYAPLQAAACIFFTPFFTSPYIVERLVFQTIYVLNKEILQF